MEEPVACESCPLKKNNLPVNSVARQAAGWLWQGKTGQIQGGNQGRSVSGVVYF
jgi:hypothetical protein